MMFLIFTFLIFIVLEFPIKLLHLLIIIYGCGHIYLLKVASIPYSIIRSLTSSKLLTLIAILLFTIAPTRLGSIIFTSIATCRFIHFALSTATNFDTLFSYFWCTSSLLSRFCDVFFSSPFNISHSIQTSSCLKIWLHILLLYYIMIHADFYQM